MHTRYLRPLEHSRTAPRRVINLSQKHSVGAVIRAVASDRLPANLVCTGHVSQHASAGGGVFQVTVGMNNEALTGTQASNPFIEAPLNIISDAAGTGDSQSLDDCQGISKLERQSTPLLHGIGFLQHIIQNGAANGSSSTVTLRDRQPTDLLKIQPTRSSPRPPGDAISQTPPPSWPDIFFYGPGGKPSTPTTPTAGPATTGHTRSGWRTTEGYGVRQSAH